MLYTSNMEQQPDMYSLEHAEKGHTERKLISIDTTPTVDKNEKLREARLALIDNDELYQRFFEGIKDLDNHDASRFSSVKNLFIRHCINLSDDEIEALVRQFNVGISEYARKNPGSIPPQHRDPEKIREMKMNSRGVLSVLEFLRARRTLLELDPATEYTFSTEDILDAKYKIDIVECIYDTSNTDTRNVHTMNLIQVKSSAPRESEISKIISGHRAWIHSAVMDFGAFRREYTDGIPKSLIIKDLSENTKAVGNILMDMCTDPDGFKPNIFLAKLDLEKLTNKHRAWLISEYVPIIKAAIETSIQEDTITPEQAAEIIQLLDQLEKNVRSKAKLPKNIGRIRNVNSIITVGKQVISEINLKSQSANTDEDSIVKYN